MSRSRTTLGYLAGLTVAALALAGCGGSSRVAHTTPVDTTTVVTRTVTTTTPPSTGPATTTTAAATATASTPVAAACTAADLTPSFLGSNGATGHVVLGFALRNTGHVTCHTYGFPGVQFLTPSGRAVATTPQRSTQDLLGSAPEQKLSLAPGQEASFRIITSDMASGPGACPSVAGLQIIAPDDTATMHVSFSTVLDCGKPSVSPLLAGSDAVPGV